MADQMNEKLLERDTITMPVIDKHYQMIGTKKATEIIEMTGDVVKDKLSEWL